ncbi:serine hydrolase domain-containing protein [Streptomyces litchfieldiae]|uniref:Uncharacterized protein n=1 Tax=Streptomyces litchfieldiae TaxID=3075543 RepID=A0ABU2MZR9_9ACTN|nr:hypothetical protein [Streptomyces sp. DSM 44938]MDT0347151.1 hypothetical protein [Streptomyces sp. DSM 44938]
MPEPAGMTGGGFFTKTERLSDDTIARPYQTTPTGERVEHTTTDAFRHTPFVGGPDGGLCATATDLLRFARTLTGGTPLPPAMAALVTSGKMAEVPAPGPADSATTATASSTRSCPTAASSATPAA